MTSRLAFQDRLAYVAANGHRAVDRCFHQVVTSGAMEYHLHRIISLEPVIFIEWRRDAAISGQLLGVCLVFLVLHRGHGATARQRGTLVVVHGALVTGSVGLTDCVVTAQGDLNVLIAGQCSFGEYVAEFFGGYISQSLCRSCAGIVTVRGSHPV